MTETRSRRRIRDAVEGTGRVVEFIEWEPIFAGSEMQGAAGGWTVFAHSPAGSAHDVESAIGLSLAEVVECIGRWETLQAPATPANTRAPGNSEQPTPVQENKNREASQ